MYMYKQVGHLEASARCTSHSPFLPFPAFRNNPHLTDKVGCFAFSKWTQCSRTYQEGCCVCVFKTYKFFFLYDLSPWQDRKTTDSQGLVKHLRGPSQYPTLHSLGLEQVQNLFSVRTLLSLVLFLPDPSLSISLGVWGLQMVCYCSCFSLGSFFSPRTSRSNILSVAMLPYEYDNLTFYMAVFSG